MLEIRLEGRSRKVLEIGDESPSQTSEKRRKRTCESTASLEISCPKICAHDVQKEKPVEPLWQDDGWTWSACETS